MTASEQQEYFNRWNLVAKGKTKISTSQLMDMIMASKETDKEMAQLIVEAYDLDGDGYDMEFGVSLRRTIRMTLVGFSNHHIVQYHRCR